MYNWGHWAAPMAHGERKVPAPRLLWVTSKRERIKIRKFRVKWVWNWLWEERGGDSQRDDTHWKPAGGARTSNQSRAVGYGVLDVVQQLDVVGLLETNYILDGVKKSMESRMVQPQERACYKRVEKIIVHTTCRDDELLICWAWSCQRTCHKNNYTWSIVFVSWSHI